MRLRIHRTLSWLTKAAETKDEDTRFISLWIAFNAMYARNLNRDLKTTDRGEFRHYLNTVCMLDTDKKIYNLVWSIYSNNIRLLLDNQFVFQPFWDAQNGEITQATWQEKFNQEKEKVHRALAAKDTDTVLASVFGRLYTLRNQLIHGGATHNSSANRSQIRDGNAILQSLLPIILKVMISHNERKDWGVPHYPVVK